MTVKYSINEVLLCEYFSYFCDAHLVAYIHLIRLFWTEIKLYLSKIQALSLDKVHLTIGSLDDGAPVTLSAN